jgi:imidazolonepropionase-like amidohydrolase
MWKYASVLILSSALFAQNSASSRAVVLKAARVLDVKSGSYISGAAILVEGDRIKQVGQSASVLAQAPKNTPVLDLGSATMLPGLIDAHTHLLQNYDPKLDETPNMVLTVARMSTAKRALLGDAMGRQDLEAGITTVRDLGNSGVSGDVALRDAINAGWVIGPRIVASTRALAAPGGQFEGLQPAAQSLVELEYAPVVTPEDGRRAVQQALADGADCIKVIGNAWGDEKGDVGRLVAPDTLRAIVEEAHRVHRKVAVHAIGDIGTRSAADAGVDSIEHGYFIPDDVLKEMAAKHIYLVPTDIEDSVVELFASGAPPDQRRQEIESLRYFMSTERARLRKAIAAGVPIAAGSDMYYDLPGHSRGQASLLVLRAYVEAGMTPIQVIRAATVNAADLLGLSGDVGSLAPGKYADIIGVSGDPMQDANELQHVKFVMKGGAVIRNDLGTK